MAPVEFEEENTNPSPNNLTPGKLAIWLSLFWIYYIPRRKAKSTQIKLKSELVQPTFPFVTFNTHTHTWTSTELLISSNALGNWVLSKVHYLNVTFCLRKKFHYWAKGCYSLQVQEKITIQYTPTSEILKTLQSRTSNL